MDFREATDRLTDCVTLSHVAEAMDRSDASIRRARLDPDTDSYRSPPDGWQPALAQLARERAKDLLELADELEG